MCVCMCWNFLFKHQPQINVCTHFYTFVRKFDELTGELQWCPNSYNLRAPVYTHIYTHTFIRIFVFAKACQSTSLTH